MSCSCSMEPGQSPEQAAARHLSQTVNTLMLARLIEGRSIQNTLLGDPLANTFLEMRALAASDFERNDGQINLAKTKEDLLHLRSEGDTILQDMPDDIFYRLYNGVQFADYYESGERHRHVHAVNLQPVLDYRGDYEDVFGVLRVFGFSEKYAAGSAGRMPSDPELQCCDRDAVTACPYAKDCRLTGNMPVPGMPAFPGPTAQS